MVDQQRTTVGTVEDLHASATRVTGLSDYGDDGYLEGLAVLLAAYAEDERLTPAGSKVKRTELRGALTARLVSEAAFTQHPSVDEVRIERPIFVTGLPRTGTTAVHRLLCADAAHQGLEQWLCEVPQPRPPRESWAVNPIFTGIQAGFAKFHAENPEFAGVHYIAADTPEECWQLLRQSLMSISYESLAHIPTYSRWLDAQDWTPAYERHRRNLALIGLNDLDKRWVLKNPSHMVALDALLAVYPDAIVVHTHRDPRSAVASAASLSELATRGLSERFVGEQIGHDSLDLLGREADRFLAARSRHDPAHFLDVAYEDLVADPVGTIETVYKHFDLPWAADVRAAVEVEDRAGRSGHRAPKHAYTLADVGLTEADVDARFGDYVATYRS